MKCLALHRKLNGLQFRLPQILQKGLEEIIKKIRYNFYIHQEVHCESWKRCYLSLLQMG